MGVYWGYNPLILTSKHDIQVFDTELLVEWLFFWCTEHGEKPNW